MLLRRGLEDGCVREVNISGDLRVAHCMFEVFINKEWVLVDNDPWQGFGPMFPNKNAINGLCSFQDVVNNSSLIPVETSSNNGLAAIFPLLFHKLYKLRFDYIKGNPEAATMYPPKHTTPYQLLNQFRLPPGSTLEFNWDSTGKVDIYSKILSDFYFFIATGDSGHLHEAIKVLTMKGFAWQEYLANALTDSVAIQYLEIIANPDKPFYGRGQGGVPILTLIVPPQKDTLTIGESGDLYAPLWVTDIVCRDSAFVIQIGDTTIQQQFHISLWEPFSVPKVTNNQVNFLSRGYILPFNDTLRISMSFNHRLIDIVSGTSFRCLCGREERLKVSTSND